MKVKDFILGFYFMEVIIVETTSKFEKVIELFNDDGDEKALKLLYKITKDKLVKIALDWRKEYAMQIEDTCTDASFMYQDIIEHLYDKYKLNDLSKNNDDKDNDYDYEEK